MAWWDNISDPEKKKRVEEYIQRQMKYWQERESAYAQATKASEDELAARLKNRLNNLMTELDKQIHGFYSRYAKAEGITMAEAMQKVSQMDVKAFEEKAAKYVKTRDFSKQANDELRLYNATMKINRLEMLKAEMGLEMVDAFNDLDDMLREGLTERTLAELERQAGILQIHQHDITGRADSIVNGSLNSATFSDRIWMYQGQLKNSLATILTNGFTQGRNPRELATELVKTFGVARNNAERLMATEMCRVQTEAQMDSFKRNGYEKYMFIDTEDTHTCDICREAARRCMEDDGWYVEDAQTGENMPPMHPNCRCSTSAWMSRADLERELGWGEESSNSRVRSYGEAPDYPRNPVIDAFETEEEIKNYFPEIRFFKNFSNLTLKTQKEVAQGFDFMRTLYGKSAMPKLCGASEKTDYGVTIMGERKINFLHNLDSEDGFSTACHECIHVLDYNKGLLSFRKYDKINQTLLDQGYDKRDIEYLMLDILGVDLYPKYYKDESELFAYAFEEYLYGSTNELVKLIIDELEAIMI